MYQPTTPNKVNYKYVNQNGQYVRTSSLDM